MTEDLGMFFIPDLNCLLKIYKDSKGMFVRLPNDRKHKAYLEEKKN